METKSVNEKASVPNQMRVIKLEPGSTFTANGTQYSVAESFAIGRFERVEELEQELLQFSDNKSCHKIMVTAMDMINKQKPGEAYMLLRNKVDSDQRNAKTIHYTLRLCAAYINFEGEDISSLTDDVIKRKINDWSVEGLDVRPFLGFAVSAFSELMQHFKKPILDILNQAISIKESLEQVMDMRNLISENEPGPERPQN